VTTGFDNESLTQLTAMSTSTLRLDTATSSADAQEYATGPLATGPGPLATMAAGIGVR
jgi:hypothetical protein